MKPYVRISRLLLCMAALCVVATVISIPVVSALHTHAHHVDGCIDGHGGGAATGDDSTCGFCALYAQFTLSEALPAPVFSFCLPVNLFLTVLAQPQAKALCTGAADPYDNRGPPALFNLA